MATKKSIRNSIPDRDDTIAGILNETTFVMKAMHELADGHIAGEGPSAVDLCVAVKAMAKSCARSLDCCAVALGGNGSRIGILDDETRLLSAVPNE